jgi:biotin transport system substrate-specific component
VVGLPWLAAATGFTLSETIDKGLTPFLVGDLVKLVLAGALFPFAWWVVGRRPGER